MNDTNYYPFGLTMSGISSSAHGKLENKRGYNGNELQNKEFSNSSGLELYDFNARTFDQQIGRFIQIDPLADKESQETLTPYHFGNNNPIRYNDPDGKCPTCPNINVQGLVNKLWNSLGISKSYSGKEFAQDMGQAAKNPNNYKAAVKTLGQFTVLTLVGIAAEGAGSGSLFTVGTRGMRNTVSASLEAGEVGLAARTRLGTVGAQEAPTTNLFRAVSEGELADVGANGLRMAPGGYETGKLFATSSSDAAQFGKSNFLLDGKPNTIIKVEVPSSVMRTTTAFEADGMKAVSVPANQLSNISKVTPLNHTPKPTNPFWMQGW